MNTLIVTPTLAEAFHRGLDAIKRCFTSDQVNAAIARPCQQLTQAHLYDLASTRHRPHVGLNFYADAADSISSEAVEDGVEIRSDKTGLAQRFFGGDIEPVNKSHLWIPVAGSPAEGRAPGEFWPFDHIVINKSAGGQSFAEKAGQILFWLVNHVHQDPDPSVLPSDDEYQEAAERGIDLLRARAEQEPSP